MLLITPSRRSPEALAAAVGMLLLFANYLAGVITVKSDPRGEATEPGARSNRYLKQGGVLSVLALALVGNRMAPGDTLAQLLNCLGGASYAIAGGILAFGITLLGRLWKELLPQYRGAGVVPLLKAIPMSIVWLAAGLGAFVGFGGILKKFPRMEEYLSVLSFAIWGVIAFVLMRLWSSRGKAALLTRTYLLLLSLASS